MSVESRVVDILLQYEHAHSQGHDVSITELCCHCPELRTEVRRRMDDLCHVNPMLKENLELPTRLDQQPANGKDPMPSRQPGHTGSPFDTTLDAEEVAETGLWRRPAGRFRPVKFHAAGGLGEVHLAVDGELGRRVALKRMAVGRSRDAIARRRFLREAAITARLEHPGIVPVYGLVTDEKGQPCYAMRFIRGESLHEAIDDFHCRSGCWQVSAEQNLALRRLLQHIVAVCNTMNYAHYQGVIHRDLKPSNIMLGDFGETLVVDWGLAKQFRSPLGNPSGGAVDARYEFAKYELTDDHFADHEDDVDFSWDADYFDEEEALTVVVPSPPSADHEATSVYENHTCNGQSNLDGPQTSHGRVLGTPAYMSPEQAAGRIHDLGPPCDIFSLGATLYYLLTGRAPASGKNAAHVLSNVLAGRFASPRKINRAVPKALEAICLKAMSREIRQRYTTAGELAQDLEHWLADEPVAAHQERFSARVRRWIRKHQRLATGAAATLGVVLLTLLAGMSFIAGMNYQ